MGGCGSAADGRGLGGTTVGHGYITQDGVGHTERGSLDCGAAGGTQAGRGKVGTAAKKDTARRQ